MIGTTRRRSRSRPRMRTDAPGRRGSSAVIAAIAIVMGIALGSSAFPSLANAQSSASAFEPRTRTWPPSPILFPRVGPPSRQVTLFAVVADPNNTAIDPKLKPIEAQLKRLLPRHGFRLLDSRSQRLATNGEIQCKIDNTLAAKAELVDPLDANGKMEFCFSLVTPGGGNLVSTIVSVPPNQLCFYDKALPDGSRLLIGIGGR